MALNDFILNCEKENKQLRKDIDYYKNKNMRTERENSKLKQALNEIREYCSTKIIKSFKYDYGIDNSDPTDRLFTETVTELQCILQIIDKFIGEEKKWQRSKF